jgi:hypothetical protein
MSRHHFLSLQRVNCAWERLAEQGAQSIPLTAGMVISGRIESRGSSNCLNSTPHKFARIHASNLELLKRFSLPHNDAPSSISIAIERCGPKEIQWGFFSYRHLEKHCRSVENQ